MRKLLLCLLFCAVALAAVAEQRRPPTPAPEIETESGLAPPPMIRYYEGQSIYRVTEDEVKPPYVLQQPEPAPLKDFAIGRVVLWCVVGTDGKAHLITIAKHYTMEADMKAVENLKQWKFKPGKKKDNEAPILTAQEVIWR